MYESFHLTTIGASHIKSNTVCQDASIHLKKAGYQLIAVSDGHGGTDYVRSHLGSQFAIDAFVTCVEEAFINQQFKEILNTCRTDKQIEQKLQWFMRSIIMRWNDYVEKHYHLNPFQEDELNKVSEKAKGYYQNNEKYQSAYGATLIGVVLCNDFYFGIQIGDGTCVIFDQEGNPQEPIPWDNQCFLNVTTSICDANASSEMRYYFNRKLPIAIVVASDGIDDSFKNKNHLYNFYRLILTSFVNETKEKAINELENYLPQLSAQGSCDDMSIACLIDLQYIKQHPSNYEKEKIIYLQITREGNLGTQQEDDTYKQQKVFEASIGSVYLDTIGCGGFHKGIKQLEIKLIQQSEVIVEINGNTYTIDEEHKIELKEELVVGELIQYDHLTIQCIIK